jgi:hypothetical protein
MRFLGIGAALRQHINSGAHRRDTQKLEIGFALLTPLEGKIVDVEEVRHSNLNFYALGKRHGEPRLYVT